MSLKTVLEQLKRVVGSITKLLWSKLILGFNQNNPLKKIGNINFWVDSRAYNIIENTHLIWLLAVNDLIFGNAEYTAWLALIKLKKMAITLSIIFCVILFTHENTF